MTDAVLHRAFSARLDCHYLVRSPGVVDSATLLVATLHGFAQTPEAMLLLTARMFHARHVIASIQGPNQFFLDAKAQDVGYGWITNRRPQSSIRLHHDMVRHVLNEAGDEAPAPSPGR